MQEENLVQKSIQVHETDSEKVTKVAKKERRSWSGMAGILMLEGLEARERKEQVKTSQA